MNIHALKGKLMDIHSFVQWQLSSDGDSTLPSSNNTSALIAVIL